MKLIKTLFLFFATFTGTPLPVLLISNLSRNITGIVYCCCFSFVRCFSHAFVTLIFPFQFFQRVFSSRLVSVLMSGSSRRHFGHVVNYIYCISQSDLHTHTHTQAHTQAHTEGNCHLHNVFVFIFAFIFKFFTCVFCGICGRAGFCSSVIPWNGNVLGCEVCIR